MTMTVEALGADPFHHEGIGVGEKDDAIALPAQCKQFIKIALGHIATGIALPGPTALFEGDSAVELALELSHKGGLINETALQFAKDAVLGLGVKLLGSIFHAKLLKTADGLLRGERYDDAAEITPAEDVTLYAQWLEDACIVTFDKNNDDVAGENYT